MGFKETFRKYFHILATLTYLSAMVGYEQLPHMPHRKSHEHFAKHYKYLTYWNLVIQFLFFTLSSIIDLMGSPSGTTYKLMRLRDKMYSSLAMPFGLFVFAMFWGLYAVNRELIFPVALDGIFPSWLNHISHTVILPVLLADSYVVKHRHPRRQTGLLYTSAFAITYFVWIMYLALEKDIWVYPILQIINWPQRCIFFVLSIFLIFMFYIIGERINRICWGNAIVYKTK